MHILFDADWTFLANNYLVAHELWVENEAFQLFFTEAFPKTVTGEADLKEVLAPYLPQMWWKGSVQDFLDIWFSSQELIREWMLDLLVDLKNRWYRCSLCSQQEKYRSAYLKSQMWFDDLFHTCYFTSDFWCTKKDPRFYTSIIDHSTIGQEKTLFIDDKISYCQTAEQVWIQAYHFNGNVNKLRTWLLETWVLL